MPGRYLSQKDRNIFERFNKELIGDLANAKDGIINQTVIIYKISTYDSHSKRWGKFTKIFKEWNIRKKFKELYSCKNYKKVSSNPSRKKELWIENLINE